MRNPYANAGDAGSIPGSGRSPAGGDGNPLQSSRLENPADSGAWRAAVQGAAESDTTEQACTCSSPPLMFPASVRQLLEHVDAPCQVPRGHDFLSRGQGHGPLPGAPQASQVPSHQVPSTQRGHLSEPAGQHQPSLVLPPVGGSPGGHIFLILYKPGHFFYWLPGIGTSTLLVAEYFCFPVKLLELYFVIQFGCL